MSAPPPSLPGLVLERLLGEGAMGQVWAGRREDGAEVAVKLLRPQEGPDRFSREVEALQAVSHPNLVRFLGAGEAGGQRYLVTERVDGGSLQDLFALGALGPAGLAQLLAGVAEGLAALHQRGIVHRDVKPGNVLVDATLRPRLIDFGLAAPLARQGSLTASHQAVGTPLYLAPEVLDGERPGPAADVWSLGLVLLEGLSGGHPLRGLPLAEALERLARAELPLPPPEAPPHLAALCRGALQRDPARRPGAAELAAALAAFGAEPQRDPGAAAATRIAPGARVGPYRIEGFLGSGGMGEVFAARHEALQVVRVLKVLPAVKSASARERFLREGRILAKVGRHPGLVGVHDSSQLPDGRPWLAFDRIEGPTLQETLQAGQLEWQALLRIGAGVAQALSHLHAQGVAHRDLKPANVLLRAPDRSPILIDFGVALDTAEDRLTISQAVLGTLTYLAPEQILADRQRVGPPCDVFALALLLWEALAGEHPFAGPTVPAQLSAVLRGPTPSLLERRPDLPRDLDRLLAACLEKDPARRPGAEEVALGLEAVAAGGRWRGAGVAVRIAGAALLLVALAALAAWVVWRSAPPPGGSGPGPSPSAAAE